MATTYTYRMPWGETLRISADLSQATAPISYEGLDLGDGAEWTQTPYQTADARHDEREMLRLVVDHLGAEWYADPSSDLSHEGQLRAAVDGARLISVTLEAA